MDIVGRRNWYFLLSLAIILPGIVSMAFFGFRLGIDFAGGDQYNLAFTQPVQASAVQKEMDTFNVEAIVQQAGPDGVLVTTKPLASAQETTIRADLANLPLFFGGLGMMFPGLEPGPIVAEVRTRLLEELDYANEAANQRLFADYWRDHPFIHVPDVLSQYSTARVLTTELAEGARFSDAEQWSQEERNLAAEAIFRFVFNSMYRMKAFNGDPHPGNYLFRPGGQVTFLDFGLIKHFDDEDVRIFEDMIRAIVLEEDPRQARIAIERAGILPASAPIDDQHVFEYFSFFYRGASPTSDAYDAEYTAEMSRRYFDLTGPYADVPAVTRARRRPPGLPPPRRWH